MLSPVLSLPSPERAAAADEKDKDLRERGQRPEEGGGGGLAV